MALKRVFVLLAVFCWQNGLCSELCQSEDTICLTEGVRKAVKHASDAFHMDLIKGELPTVKYTVTNASLSGFQSCIPEFISVNPKDTTFESHIACPLLIGIGLYKVNGDFDTLHIEGTGDYYAEHYDYVYMFHGVYGKENDKEGKMHVFIKQYQLDINARGKVTYDFRNLYNGDIERSAATNKYMNENWKAVDIAIRQPLMEKFISLFINDINAYFKAIPAEEIFQA